MCIISRTFFIEKQTAPGNVIIQKVIVYDGGILLAVYPPLPGGISQHKGNFFNKADILKYIKQSHQNMIY